MQLNEGSIIFTIALINQESTVLKSTYSICPKFLRIWENWSPIITLGLTLTVDHQENLSVSIETHESTS